MYFAKPLTTEPLHVKKNHLKNLNAIQIPSHLQARALIVVSQFKKVFQEMTAKCHYIIH